jgi:hypothetical protein
MIWHLIVWFIFAFVVHWFAVAAEQRQLLRLAARLLHGGPGLRWRFS